MLLLVVFFSCRCCCWVDLLFYIARLGRMWVPELLSKGPEDQNHPYPAMGRKVIFGKPKKFSEKVKEFPSLFKIAIYF